jgi:hypothetical protein
MAWRRRSANSSEGRRRGGGETVLGGSRHGGEAIWGSGEGGKLTGRLVHGGATWAEKHDGDGAVRGQGRPVLGLGSIRTTLGSSRRWRPGRRSPEMCCLRGVLEEANDLSSLLGGA